MAISKTTRSVTRLPCFKVLRVVTVAVAFAGLLSPTQAVAQNCDMIPIVKGLIGHNTVNINSNFECLDNRIALLYSGIAVLNRENAELKRQLSDVTQHLQRLERAPTNAVIAFDDATLQDTCPEGWSPFRAGRGRFIVGAGKGENLSSRPARAVGGEEMHKLTIEEMSRHQHVTQLGSIKVASDPNSTTQAVVAGGNSPKPRNLGTNGMGASEPHNNMPPYIALYFCKKD